MLGRDITVAEPPDPVTAATPGGVVVGVYVREGLRTAALVALDLPLAARAGAALALLPPRVADRAVEAQHLDDALAENVSEVLNVISSLLNTDDAPHVRLYRVHGPAGLLPADVAGWLRGYGRRTDVAFDIRGYGEGAVSVVVL
ncbi:hypothetical protein GB881_13660 [Georgenia subflava]|uniref:Uncharacterized protein n=2 Tax=Georgenia subflava TaxID=1622177 RepID=A0A6N7EMI6_9MICO|nr:hypothetical protein [Georgenia subflava]